MVERREAVQCQQAMQCSAVHCIRLGPAVCRPNGVGSAPNAPTNPDVRAVYDRMLSSAASAVFSALPPLHLSCASRLCGCRWASASASAGAFVVSSVDQ